MITLLALFGRSVSGRKDWLQDDWLNIELELPMKPVESMPSMGALYPMPGFINGHRVVSSFFSFLTIVEAPLVKG